MQVKEELQNDLGREPTVEEIAQKLGTQKENVVLALEAIVDPVSLYEPVFSDGADTIYVMDQVGDKSDDSDWLEEIAFKEAMRKLTPREKKILALRYFRAKPRWRSPRRSGSVRRRSAASKRARSTPSKGSCNAEHPPCRVMTGRVLYCYLFVPVCCTYLLAPLRPHANSATTFLAS